MSLKIDISQVSAAMDAVAEAVRAVHVRLTIDAMFSLTFEAAAGRTGPADNAREAHMGMLTHLHVCSGMPGGLLFESFIVTSGKRKSRRAMLALAKVCRREQRECTAEEAAELVAAERVGFYFSVLNGLANRGRSANRQLFFLSLLAQAKGLSRTGMDVLGAMNVCLAPRTFDLELNTYLVTVAERERSAASRVG